MRRIPKNQHCRMKKGMGSMMVLGSYLTTIRNSVTVIAATSHACWPSFLWNFLLASETTQCHEIKKNQNNSKDVFCQPTQFCYSRVLHEVVDLPHGHAPNVNKKDEAEQHKVVLRRHPQNTLQVEGVQLGQKELVGEDIKKCDMSKLKRRIS